MTILDRPPSDWRRPSMTLAAKVAAWERMYGPVNYDHRPPLSDRKFDTDTNNTIPPANDPDFIDPISVKDHDTRTNGPGGEKRITTLSSDANNRAKTRNIRKDLAALNARMEAKRTGNETPQRRSKIPSRPFPKQQRPLRGRKFNAQRS